MIEEWDKRKEVKSDMNKDSKKRLEILEKERLETISIQRRNELDLEDYTNEISRIKTEITNLKSRDSDTEIDDTLFNKLLDNAEDFLNNIEPLYNTFPISKKRELIQIIYPGGVKYGNGTLRTKEKSYLFNVLDTLSTGNYQMVGVQGLEP